MKQINKPQGFGPGEDDNEELKSTDEGMVTVTVISHNNGGMPENVLLKKGTTLKEYIEEYKVNTKTNLIRVDRERREDDFVINDGMRITMTPTNIKGA